MVMKVMMAEGNYLEVLFCYTYMFHFDIEKLAPLLGQNASENFAEA
jgi:hypothetical protein